MEIHSLMFPIQGSTRLKLFAFLSVLPPSEIFPEDPLFPDHLKLI